MGKLYENIGLRYDIRTKLMSDFKLPNTLRKGFCLVRRSTDYRHYKEYYKNYKRLEELHNKHKGERCFVVGMGPSLDKTKFDLIKDEHFIVSNSFYVGMDKFKVKPEYWVVADDAVWDVHYKQLLSLDTTLFLTEDASRIFLNNKKHYMKNAKIEPIVIKPLGCSTTWMKLSKDLTKGAYGGMVICSSLQIAFYLGFKEVYLLGCDCSKKAGSHFKGATHIDKIGDMKFSYKSVFDRRRIKNIFK